MWNCPWVACEGLVFSLYVLDVRAAFGFDICCLFPPCLQPIIPWMVDVHRYDLHVLQAG